MEKVTFECEVITPMFISGADGKTPELRASSVKGALRFWWRARYGNLSISDLKQKESEIFGSTKETVGKSKISINVKHPSNDAISNIYNLKRELKIRYQGIQYLFYSPLFLSKRAYFKEGTKFSINITLQNHSVLDEAIKSFLLLALFGGLGSRTRRGAGSFRLINIKGKGANSYKNFLPSQNIHNKTQLKDYLSKILKEFTSHHHLHQLYSTLSKKIYIMDPKDNWKDALESIGLKYKLFRSGKKSSIKLTPNFGFPIVHTVYKKNKKYRIIMQAGKKEGDRLILLKRRASPLILKLIKTSEKNYFPIVLWLNGDLLPPNYKIMDNNGFNEEEPNDNIVQEFLKKIPNCEVIE